ncbi:hypothetical protein GW17_00018277 [Ensete ventricosum]|nr:hypothetical protein GW17_00018277 [Ensete ventricosum]RZS13951.1 hypothetical protein BHM03_00045584 [Ensete ventricosum]
MTAKEEEAHQKRIRKELEKQDNLRRKVLFVQSLLLLRIRFLVLKQIVNLQREEQIQREIERHDRERRKEEERLMREKQREEERFQREQRRENERREKFLLKESRRAEKLRQKEELRREKEAARLKAATERATARRIAKEYMELIEDERLELMELAAANKGFSSIFALENETLQQLDSFRSMLTAFPPSSVRLKKPFAIQPWADSDEKIANLLMNSGLRDLTTSKTPEASIAAALSRDTKLFERTAPSTYCVRSPYRKDPADADTVLSAAREKIQVFLSALSDSEEAEKDTEDVDEAERDEDSEGDAADDPEVDDVCVDAKLDKNDPFASELKDSRTLTLSCKEEGGENGVIACTNYGNVEKGPKMPLEKSKTVSTSGVSHLPDGNSSYIEASNLAMEDTEIDESNFGEPWVQGLSEGDYSELSVEERLHALIALVGVAVEGNSIRIVLEVLMR